MSRTSQLKLDWRASKSRPDRLFTRYLIDGHDLLDTIERVARHRIDDATPFGWTTESHQRQYVDRLLLRGDPVLPSGRRELFVCSECADLGCGCVCADVRRDGDHFIWSRFGTENDYDPTTACTFTMGELRFDAAALERALASAITPPPLRNRG